MWGPNPSSTLIKGTIFEENFVSRIRLQRLALLVWGKGTRFEEKLGGEPILIIEIVNTFLFVS